MTGNFNTIIHQVNMMVVLMLVPVVLVAFDLASDPWASILLMGSRFLP